MPIERNYDQFIMTVLANIQKESIFSQYPCGVYMVYGSYVIQEQNTHSDMDILYIHKEEDNKPFRMQFYYQQLPITMYFVSKTDFQEDSNGKYGGYLLVKH